MHCPLLSAGTVYSLTSEPPISSVRLVVPAMSRSPVLHTVAVVDEQSAEQSMVRLLLSQSDGGFVGVAVGGGGGGGEVEVGVAVGGAGGEVDVDVGTGTNVAVDVGVGG